MKKTRRSVNRTKLEIIIILLGADASGKRVTVDQVCNIIRSYSGIKSRRAIKNQIIFLTNEKIVELYEKKELIRVNSHSGLVFRLYDFLRESPKESLEITQLDFVSLYKCPGEEWAYRIRDEIDKNKDKGWDTLITNFEGDVRSGLMTKFLSFSAVQKSIDKEFVVELGRKLVLETLFREVMEKCLGHGPMSLASSWKYYTDDLVEEFTMNLVRSGQVPGRIGYFRGKESIGLTTFVGDESPNAERKFYERFYTIAVEFFKGRFQEHQNLWEVIHEIFIPSYEIDEIIAAMASSFTGMNYFLSVTNNELLSDPVLGGLFFVFAMGDSSRFLEGAIYDLVFWYRAGHGEGLNARKALVVLEEELRATGLLYDMEIERLISSKGEIFDANLLEMVIKTQNRHRKQLKASNQNLQSPILLLLNSLAYIDYKTTKSTYWDPVKTIGFSPPGLLSLENTKLIKLPFNYYDLLPP